MTGDLIETRTDNRAVKLSLPLAQSIHDALKQDATRNQREVTEHIQRILAEYAIDKKLIPQEDAARLQLMWRLVERAVEAAQRICRDGGFSPAITLNAIRACMEKPDWVAGYREFIQDDIYKNGNPLKGVINREIGFRIRAGIGGKVAKTADGKAATAKVLGEIIQSYTPMDAFDPKAVEA